MIQNLLNECTLYFFVDICLPELTDGIKSSHSFCLDLSLSREVHIEHS